MNVGVAKEIKQDEYRVALTPAGALELTRHGHNVVVEQGAGEGSAFPDSAYTAVGARIGSVDEVWADSELVLKVKEPHPRGVRPAARGPGAVHLSPSRRQRGAHEGADGERRGVCRVRDGRDRRPCAAAAGADERDRRPPGLTGRSDVPREAARRARAAARRRARRRDREGGRDRRRDGRLQRRRHRPRARRRGDDPGALDRSHAAPGGGARLARHAADVQRAPDRGVGRRGGPRHRRRAHSRGARPEADHARDGRGHEGGLGGRGRGDRPGRLRRDLEADNAHGSGLRRRGRHALLRREHARRRADHLHEGADERDASVCRGDCGSRAPRGARAETPPWCAA